ncbi:hypothetical protein [Georgenia sp. Z1491]|uniref:hypothetical protein n=1 Tax=Georgenia sp. Z1491 TaxID=3416707 RepID=UPI003CEFF17B
MDRARTVSRAHLILGTSLAFVIGTTIMVALHETSHAVVGALYGSRPTQLPFAVSFTPELSTNQAVVELLAGPAFSLLTGVAGVVVDRVYTPFRTRPFWRLVWLWTVFTSLQEAFGYLQVTAILDVGDTAQAFELLNAPPAAYVAATVVGWACLPLTAWAFSVPIRGLAATVQDRTDMTVWPWLIGTGGFLVLMAGYVLLAAVDDPATVVAVLAAAVSLGVFAPMSMMFRAKRADAETPPAIGWPPVGGLVLLAALVAGNIVLTQGWIWP